MAYSNRAPRLTLPAPEIVKATLEGRQPVEDDAGDADAAGGGGVVPSGTYLPSLRRNRTNRPLL